MSRMEIDSYDNEITNIKPKLWVDKYRPKSYKDLVGDESVNRDVLTWLVQWNYCVFEKGTPHKDNIINTQFNDRWDRPEKKILLLTGPPGCGKTTLAHVVATHCGYNIVEINASDDRTGQVIKNKIKDALETRSAVFNKKPNMIIIDEIDGVSSSGDENFVKLLLDLVDGEKQSSRDVNQLMPKGNKTSKKKKAVKKPLLRPIICICNDQYTAALRPLKAYAKIVNFKRMQSNRLAKRLKEICDREKLSADITTLFVLAESAEGDLRNCLTTLQFIKQSSNKVTRELILNTNIGQKDANKSLFTIWEEIFQIRSSKIRSHDSVVARNSENNVDRYISRLEFLISTNGEYEKLMQGCFENYLKYNFHDQKFKISQINEWIHFYDQINHRSNSMQLFGLFAYFPYPIICFHRFFSGVAHPHLEYPRKDYECYVQQQANENIMSSALNGIKTKYRLTLNRNIFITEFVSYLLKIVSPELESDNGLSSNLNKSILSRVADIMLSFNLKYIQKIEDGKTIYAIEPPIDQLALFSNKKRAFRSDMTKRLIAKEIDIKIESAAGTRSISVQNQKSSSISQSESKSLKGQEKQILDFFGRPKTNMELDKESRQSGGNLIKPKVWYRYHEGSSKAVRTKMKLKNFL
ncbi:P-loop containing nucleoside triphosphate hydrolase protein [Gigaspora rosea]|uniref:P-loop containing nucleoside triphosphate hydrolase protein n=1 Tax=Gigaspora rosea TaxID=44941 RepID=A0A397VKD2_9GLOM|nr:P-loop containing nucleoside triphosphate hydrolase protein [Gigaspora rosea]